MWLYFQQLVYHKKEIYMAVGDNIRKLRKEKGLTQKELAEKLNTHYTNINRIENNKYIPSLNTLMQVADLFDVTLDYLATGKEDELQEVRIEDKKLAEKFKLIDSLEKEERRALITIIDSILTKKKFKDFFQQEIATG
jgi:transcriptional regulator with XRE-family HTH domain